MKRWVVLFFIFAATLFAALSPAERMNAKLLEHAQGAFEKEQWVEAYQAFVRLERTPENLPIIHFYLGRCAYEMGAYETAEEHFKAVLKLKPGHPTASYELARVHLRYARRHENEARELFAVIPPKELPKEARRVVSNYTGFTRLPSSHRVKGEIGAFFVTDSQAPALPQQIDDRIPLPDPSPSATPRDSSQGNLLTLTLKHRYQENDSCGFRWENRIEGDALNHPGIEKGNASRLYLGTRLSFRVEERFWFSPEYFLENTGFNGGDRTFLRAGWALNVEGAPTNTQEAWARLAWYNQYYNENNESTQRGVSGRVGSRHYFGRNYAQAELGVDTTHDGDAENEVGLYTQSTLSALWFQHFTPAAAGKVGGDFMLVNFDGPMGRREDRVFSGSVALDLGINEDWAFDYLVKMSKIDSDEPGGSYTRSIARLGVRYTF